MPALPTFDVSTATAERLLATFAGEHDETGALLTPQQAYKRWLRSSLVSHVMSFEARKQVDDLTTKLTI